ncbi:MAG: hypothetical protein RTU30_14215 [Candidatus Thorarchaeota archaeon]
MKKHATLNKALFVMMLFLVVSSTINASAHITASDNETTTVVTTTTVDTTTEDTTEVETTEVETTEEETTEVESTTEDETETEMEDEDDDPNDRQLEVLTTPTSAEIQSKLESGANEDTFKIGVTTGIDGVEFKVEYEVENGTAETEREFEVRFEELVEFLDVNDNGVYDDEVDTEVQTLLLVDFDPIIYTIENGSSGNIHIFDVMTTDGIFWARTYAIGDFADINGTTVAPTQVKIDVIISGFNFSLNDSRLALKVKLETSTETTFDDSTEDEEDGRAIDEAEIDIVMSGFNGFFSWKETAEIDGVTHAVNSSIHELEGNEQEIYLNYPQGDVIIHDPKVGFENLLVATGGFVLDDFLASGYLPLALVGGIVLIGVVVVVKRRS